MTSYVLNGFSVTYNEVTDEVETLAAASLLLRYNDGIATFTYTVTAPPDPMNGELLPYVDILPEPEAAQINGLGVSEFAEVSIGYVDSTYGRTDVLVIEDGTHNHIFQIGGAAIPIPTTPAEATALDGAITGGGVSSAFPPGTPIAWTSLAGVTVEEDEWIDGTLDAELLLGGAGNDTIDGDGGDDTIDGGDGDDEISVGEGNPLILGSAGSDLIDFTYLINGYAMLDYAGYGATANASIDVTIDGVGNSGTIQKVEEGSGIILGSDMIVEVDNPLYSGWNLGGLYLIGTQHGDDFSIVSPANSWASIAPGSGADSIATDVSAGNRGIRIDYRDSPGGVIADLSTGTISNDGFGFTDTITGSISELVTGDGNDSVMGSAGNDRFILGAGTDTLDGGAGRDLLRFDRAQIDSGVNVDLGAGTASGSWNGTAFSQVLSNIEDIRGSSHDDLIAGGSEDNNLRGYAGNDTLLGNGGNDTLIGGGGDDNFDGGAGDDLIIVGEGNPMIVGSGGSDFIDFTGLVNGYATIDYWGFGSSAGSAVDVVIDGTINSGTVTKVRDSDNAVLGVDTLIEVDNPLFSGWNQGGLYLRGTDYSDTFEITLPQFSWIEVAPGAGVDFIYGYSSVAGQDRGLRVSYADSPGNVVVDLTTGIVVDGFGSTDSIIGPITEIETGNGDDSVTGSSGDDRFILGGGSDSVDGGDGVDLLRYDRSEMTSGVNANLSTGTATGDWYGVGFTHTLAGIENLRGSGFGDTLTGGSDDNSLRGYAGDDTLIGNGGNDTLEGGDGADSMSGGDGADYLLGNAGNDTLLGGDGSDWLEGGDGDDLLNPGNNLGGDEFDLVLPGLGMNTIDFSQMLDGYVDIETTDISGELGQNAFVTINGALGTGLIYFTGAHQTDLVNVQNPLVAGYSEGGLGVSTTGLGDTFDLDLDAGQWMQVKASSHGSDTYTLSGDGQVRIDYRFTWDAINVDLSGATGTVTKGGGAFTDTINGRVWEIRGGSNADTMLGSGNDESFITGGGSDTIDGGGGFDRLRFDRTEFDGAVTVDADAGTASGTHFGTGFISTISNIEHFRGTSFGDTLRGKDAVNELLQGQNGDDTLQGRGGDDTLEGGNGADTFVFGAGDGNDSITDFMLGTDTLDVSGMGLTQGQLNTAYTSATNTAGGGQVDYGNGTVVTFQGVTASQLAALAGPNSKPVLTVENQTLATGTFTQLNTVWSYSDADGDALQKIRLYDASGADSWYVGTTPVSARSGVGFETSDLSNVFFHAEASAGTQTLWVRGYDGREWGAWDTFTLTTTVSNSAPTITVEDQTVAPGGYRRLNSLWNYNDADGDPLTKIQVKDNTGANSWWVGNGFVDASTGDGVIAHNPNQVWFYGEASAGTQTLSVRAFDGKDWGAWDTFDLTTSAPNTAPTITVENQTLAPGAYTRLNSVWSYNDAEGDPVTKIQVKDNTGANSWWVGNSFVDASTGDGVIAHNPNQVWFYGEASAGTQTLSVRAFDGKDWGAWDTFDLTTSGPNTPPSLTVENQTIAPGAYTRLNSVWSYNDAEGDPLTKIQVYDNTGANSWWVGNGFVDARTGSGVEATDPNQVWFYGEATAGTQTMWVRGHDGTSWGAWDTFQLTTNTAPTFTVEDQSVAANSYIRLNSVFNFTDAEGDTLQKVQVYDDTGANNWWVGNGFVDASTGSGVEATNPDQVWFYGDATPGTQTLWVRGFDGTDWSAWDEFELTTI